MRVIFFHRKPRPATYFSIENLFKYVRDALPQEVNWEVKELSFYSEGFIKRLWISLEAAFQKPGINHITGDIHFIAIFLKKRRTILTIHDVGFMGNSNFFARLGLKWFWITLPVKRSAVITTVSTSTKLELLKYVRVDPARIRVIYVPIDPKYVPSPKLFNKEEPIILHIGTKPNKNLPRVLRALRGMRYRLEIVGILDDTQLADLRRENVNFASCSNLTNEEMVKKYQEADIVSFVSTYEGFGMPIVEANAVGRVVVTSDILSMPEIADNAAHLVDPFDIDAIRQGFIKVINDDEYREQLISNGFENRRRFDAAKIARQFTEIYRLLDA